MSVCEKNRDDDVMVCGMVTVGLLRRFVCAWATAVSWAMHVDSAVLKVQSPDGQETVQMPLSLSVVFCEGSMFVEVFATCQATTFGMASLVED